MPGGAALLRFAFAPLTPARASALSRNRQAQTWPQAKSISGVRGQIHGKDSGSNYVMAARQFGRAL